MNGRTCPATSADLPNGRPLVRQAETGAHGGTQAALLTRLAEVDERQSKIVEYRFFGGFTIKEIADLLSVAPITVKREWRKARLWLRRAMQDEE